MSTATRSTNRIWVALTYMDQPVYIDAQSVLAVEQLPRGGTDPFRTIVKYENSPMTTEVDGPAKDVMAIVLMANMRMSEASHPEPVVGVVFSEDVDPLVGDALDKTKTVVDKKPGTISRFPGVTPKTNKDDLN